MNDKFFKQIEYFFFEIDEFNNQMTFHLQVFRLKTRSQAIT